MTVAIDTVGTVDTTLDAPAVEQALLAYLAEQIDTQVGLDEDLFASGLVSSMFTMQLVVHIEEAFNIAIIGPELRLENFRTVNAMTALILRLREEQE